MDVLEMIEIDEVCLVVGIRVGMAVVPNKELRNEVIELAKIGQQMQWVSVVDRKPQIMDMVDIIYQHGGKPYRAIDIIYDKFEQFGMYKNVTHWMSIPPNPGEGE